VTSCPFKHRPSDQGGTGRSLRTALHVAQSVEAGFHAYRLPSTFVRLVLSLPYPCLYILTFDSSRLKTESEILCMEVGSEAEFFRRRPLLVSRLIGTN